MSHIDKARQKEQVSATLLLPCYVTTENYVFLFLTFSLSVVKEFLKSFQYFLRLHQKNFASFKLLFILFILFIFVGEGSAYWHGSTPDLSECRSVWLNSLEARVREGESLLSISNDLAQVTNTLNIF